MSRGTVDRVINGRSNVAPEVRIRIEKVLKETGYQTPAQRRVKGIKTGTYRIGVILPSWDIFFIKRMREGIRIALNHRSLHDVEVIVEELKNRSHRAYFEAIAKLEEQKINGLILTAPDTVAMAEEIDRVSAKGIAVVTCDSDIVSSRRIYHVGQDMIRSGRIAAGLLAPYIGNGSVLVVTGNREFTAHEERVLGFLDRTHELFGDSVDVKIIESVERYEITYDGVLKELRGNEKISCIYMANESVRGCIDAIEKAKTKKRPHVVCHDLTPAACQYLNEGKLDFVINQDFSAQTTRAIEVLIYMIQTGEKPKKDVEYILTSIVTRELL